MGSGGGAGRGLAVEDSKEPWQLASLEVELIDPDARPYSSWEFLAEVERRLQRTPLTEVISFRGSGAGGPGEDSISIELSGAEAAELKAASEALQQALAAFPEVSALEDDLAYDKTELLLEITPLGESQGLTAETIGAVLRNRLTGVQAAEFAVEGRTGTITVRLPRDELTADFLSRTRIRTPSGDWAPLSELVTVSSRPGFGVLRRADGVMSVTVTGELSEDDADRARGTNRPAEGEYRLRAAVRTADKATAQYLTDEVQSLFCSGPAGGGGYRGSVTGQVNTASALVPRGPVEAQTQAQEVTS